MRVLIAGGTGFIGSALRLALESRRDDVVIISRKPMAGAVGWDSVETETERADAIVNLAGAPVADQRWTPERLDQIRASRVETTARIARAIASATRRPRTFVSGSAVGIYGMHLDDAICDEGAPPGDDELARIVVAWEAAASPAASATRVVHPRIGVVLERGAGALAKMVTPFRLFAGGPIGTGTQWLSWIHLRDVVRALLFAIDHESLAGPFNVTAPAPVNMDAFAAALGRALRRPSQTRIPAFAIRLALGAGLANVVLKGQRVVPRRLIEAGFPFEFAHLDAALAAIFG